MDTAHPDLTRCFQRTVLVWVPSGFIFLAAIPTVRNLTYNRPVHNLWKHKSSISYVKLVFSMLLCCFSVAELIYALTEDNVPTVDYVAPLIMIITYVSIAVINHIEYKYGYQTSGPVMIYWLLALLTASFTFQSKIRSAVNENKTTDDFYFAIFMAQFIFICAEFVLACLYDKQAWKSFYREGQNKTKSIKQLISHTSTYDPDDMWAQKPSREERTTFWEFILYTWLNRTIWTGYTKELKDHHCPDIDRHMKCHPTYNVFEKRWNNEIENYSTKKPLEHDPEIIQGFHKMLIIKTLVKSCGWPLLLAQLLRLMGIVLDFMNPQLLRLLIDYIDGESEYAWKGYLLAALLFVNNVIRALLMHSHYRYTCIGAIHIKMALTAAIYKKVMNLSSSAHKQVSVGEVVNMISADVERVQDACFFIQATWSTPLMIIGAMVFLWMEVGVSCLAGLAVIMILIPINGFYIGRKIGITQGELMQHRDERTGIITEILNGIKVLKLYGWELSFEKRVQEARNKEVSTLRSILIYNSLSSGFLYAISGLVSLAVFTVYSLDSDNILDADKAFVSLSLIQLLMVPIILLPIFINFSAQAMVALERIAKVLFASSIDASQVEIDPTLDAAIKVKNGNFTYDDPETPILKDINMNIDSGSLVAVVGQVGSGKSTLINTILGETMTMTGEVKVKGSIAYVPQQAWMQNATLRDNILFGKSYKEEKYDRVLEGCALKQDLSILEGGDMTEIGEKGINLSGGQKQRVSLSRAVYLNRDIYLLDDPLSAVDSHVGKHIFDHVIGPNGMLAKKTRVLVTHGLAYLPYVDYIYVMKEGEIAEAGTYHHLLEQNKNFAEFIRTYANEEQNKSSTDDNVRVMRQISKLSARSGHSGSLRPRRRSSTQSLRSLLSRHDSESEMVIGGELDMVRPGIKRDMEQEDIAKLIESETSETGTIDWRVIRSYIDALGHWTVFSCLLFWVFYALSQMATQVWLAEWADLDIVNGTRDMDDTRLYNSIYGVTIACQVLFLLLLTITLALANTNAAKSIHQKLLRNMLRVPMSFFDTTPIGRIMNRFSKDQDGVDMMISTWMRFLLLTLSPIVAVVVVISFNTPMFLIILVPLLVVYIYLQYVYMATLRQLKRIDSVKRSPIFAGFDETMTGIVSIRAYQQETRFENKMFDLIDASYSIWNVVMVGQRWISVYLEFFGALIVFFSSLFAVIARDSTSGSNVGMSVSFALQITGLLNMMVRASTELETYIVSVERINEYSELDTEDEWVHENHRPELTWPEKGTIEFQGYSTRYREGLDLVLRELQCRISPGERVGIVGRTGAGKSSMTLALFRIIEASAGAVLIDGIDTSKIGLHDLRSKLTIIPQDPVVFSGSLRDNVDPFQQHTDQEVWQALELAYLKRFVTDLSEGLEYECGEGGQSLSVGQRQLVCLARAVLRRSKILVLDEATAAVDLETDDLIQNTIKEQFKGCTVITIAHRLNTIMDYDKIMVLDKGEIREFASPTELLKNQNGIFHSMVQDAGLITTITEDVESMETNSTNSNVTEDNDNTSL